MVLKYMNGREPLLALEDIDKAFPGVQALRKANLALYSGQVHALVGENGAGKSTLVKILAGAYRPDSGRIIFEGKPVRFSSPLEAKRLGVSVIYQEFNLVPTLTARENLFLGQEAGAFIRRRRERKEAQRLFALLSAAVDPDRPCRYLSVAEQQVVEIAKALATQARILVMDEPTAALTTQEVERLFVIVRDLKARGMAVLYISHRLEEVFQIADRVTVMRDGEHVATSAVGSLTRRKLIELMVGRTLENEFPKVKRRQGEPLLEVRNLTQLPRVKGVSFVLHRGEILALTGLVGAGRTEVARLIFGAERPDSGAILRNGTQVEISSPHQAIRRGICLLPEDRKLQGLVLCLSARENFGLPNLRKWSRYFLVNTAQERACFARFVTDLRMKVPRSEEPVSCLSGGNQQKLVLAKWLASQSEVVIFDEPTRGIDVGAKYEIYLLMHRLAAEGKGILMISSELPEVLGMSDRILVMREGKIQGEITEVASATQQMVLELAVGSGT